MVFEMREEFNILNESLSIDDMNVLSLLYLPLVGTDAFSLYLALNSLKGTSSYDILIDILGIKLSSIGECLDKLQAVNLINVYKSDVLTYKIMKPLKGNDFLNNSILGLYYEGTTSIKLKKMVDLLYTDEKIDGKNITLKFSDVFKTDSTYEEYLLETKKITYDGANTNVSLGNEIDRRFDMENFFRNLKREFDFRKADNRLKNLLSNLAYVYHFNENQMKRILLESYDGNNVDYTLLKLKAKQLFEYEHYDNTPHMVSKKDTSIDPFIDNNELSIIRTEPFAIIMKEYGFNEEVMDVLKSHVLKYTTSPNVAYLRKVAEEFMKANIITKEDALTYINNSKNKIDKPKRINKKRIVEAPTWVTEEISEKEGK